MDEPRDLLFHEWPMFNQVMTNEHDICRRLLEVVLGEPVDRVRNVEVERTVEPRLGRKACGLMLSPVPRMLFTMWKFRPTR